MRSKRKTIAIITTLVGFSLVLLNGVGYLLMLDISAPGLLIIGITFFLLGGFASGKSISKQIN